MGILNHCIDIYCFLIYIVFFIEFQRYLFIRGLIALEKFQRTRHYLKSAAECTSKAVVSLDLCEHPIKSIKQAGTLEGVGSSM